MKLSKTYEPKQYEDDIYALWEKSQAFLPNPKAKQKYSIVMPPPNANADLHAGFGLVNALEDIATRYHRLKGESALFLPGADHAGFETWVVYEKQLAKQGKSRFDFNREELYKQVWDFVQQNKANFETQIRRMGASCDWTRFTFTLDDKVVKTVYSTFKKMWNEGLVYRGERLVNFCTTHGTSFADVEVQYQDIPGKLWTISYPLSDGEGNVKIATTRPETMLGDTAIAVNPNDARYKKLIGKTAHLPLTNRDIPIIADEMVQTDFGTGAVKITPAHDFADFDVAERHDLPRINVIDHQGNITREMPPAYAGRPYLEARELVLKDLKAQKLLVKEEVFNHQVGHCYKCGNPIQPLIRDQWFVDMKKLAKDAIKALEQDKIKFYPESKKSQLIEYLKGLRDWNISRQIAWGIPIPAFQNIDNPDDWIFDERVGQETIEVNGKTYHRDPDVFDTWFSSGQWPYVTLDYPDGDDYKNFYPLSLMETGGEILYPWVSRMIMLGLYVTGSIPFKEVYIHGYVMAEDGSKMSKSVGNTVSPMEIIDQFGSDALRMGIINGRVAGVNQPFNNTKFISARNFCNKLWNVARYTEDCLGNDDKSANKPKPQSLADHWILGKLKQNIELIADDLDNYRFSEAYNRLYHFVWNDYADWYIEASKVNKNPSVLAYLLDAVLKLAHPFAPFVTETIWQTLGWNKDTLLISQNWPEAARFDEKALKQFDDVQAIVSEIRYITKALEVKSPSLYFTKEPFLTASADIIKHLAKLSGCKEVESGQGMYLTQTTLSCWLDIDLNTAQKYTAKLHVNKLQHEGVIDKLQQRLDNKSYTKNAPAEVVQQTKDQMAAEQALLEKLDQELNRFSSFGANEK